MKPVKSFDNFLNENKLNKVSPSGVKYNIGDKVRVRNGQYEGKEGVIRTTYAKKHNSSAGKNMFEVYFPHLKDTVSWFSPTELEKIEVVKEQESISKRNVKKVKITVPNNDRLINLLNTTPAFSRLLPRGMKLKAGENIVDVNHYTYSEMMDKYPARGVEVEDYEAIKEAYDITKELRKGKILQAADGGELYKVISVTPTQVTLIDLEDEIEEIFPDDYKSNPKDDSPSIEDFWGYYSDLDNEHKKKLKSLK